MFAVTEVRWDLEEEEVVVVLADGTEERWELEGEAGKSSEWVEESGEDELAGDGEKAGKSRGRQDKNPTTARPSRWAPSTVSATLHDFSVRLRSAYEDLGTSSAQHPSAPTIDSENDYRQLMRLSADPTREIPFEWSDKKTMYEYAMESAAEDEEEEEEVERESQGKGGGPSQDVSVRFPSLVPLLLRRTDAPSHRRTRTRSLSKTLTASTASSAPVVVLNASLLFPPSATNPRLPISQTITSPSSFSSGPSAPTSPPSSRPPSFPS